MLAAHLYDVPNVRQHLGSQELHSLAYAFDLHLGGPHRHRCYDRRWHRLELHLRHARPNRNRSSRLLGDAP